MSDLNESGPTKQTEIELLHRVVQTVVKASRLNSSLNIQTLLVYQRLWSIPHQSIVLNMHKVVSINEKIRNFEK